MANKLRLVQKEAAQALKSGSRPASECEMNRNNPNFYHNIFTTKYEYYKEIKNG